MVKPDFDSGGHALAHEMRNTERLEEECAKDPAKNWLVSISNFIVFAVFGLGVLSLLYVAYGLLRGLLASSQ